MAPLLAGEPLLIGTPGTWTCPDCGVAVQRQLMEHANIRVWAPGRHDCPVLAARREEQAREREEWLRNPPPERVEEIHRIVRLPWWTPPGLLAVPEIPQSRQSLEALAPHRESWLSGRRPRRGLWLWGDTGLWKTGATCALMLDVAHRAGFSGLVWNFPDLMTQLRRSAQRKPHEWDAETAARAQALLIDDISAMTATDAARRTLYELLGASNDSWGSTAPTQTLYVTSDRPPEEMLDCLDPEGSDGAAARRIIRRLSQLCQVVEVCREGAQREGAQREGAQREGAQREPVAAGRRLLKPVCWEDAYPGDESEDLGDGG